MAWTDERVDLLKKLWTEGLSASQIANRLGNVTRNAVIGKVHRLGLSGRATTSRVKSIRPKKRVAKTSNKTMRPKYAGATGASAKPNFGGLEPMAKPELPTSNYVELFIPLEERKSILELKECSCRWPIGDPTDDDFHFCGRNKVPGTPYCEYHGSIAFNPMHTRRKQRELKAG